MSCCPWVLQQRKSAEGSLSPTRTRRDSTESDPGAFAFGASFEHGTNAHPQVLSEHKPVLAERFGVRARFRYSAALRVARRKRATSTCWWTRRSGDARGLFRRPVLSGRPAGLRGRPGDAARIAAAAQALRRARCHRHRLSVTWRSTCATWSSSATVSSPTPRITTSSAAGRPHALRRNAAQSRADRRSGESGSAGHSRVGARGGVAPGHRHLHNRLAHAYLGIEPETVGSSPRAMCRRSCDQLSALLKRFA